MFLRFRQRLSDGREPSGIVAQMACQDACKQRRRWGGAPIDNCPVRPLCRWRIGTKAGLALQPYTLVVSLLENRRVNAKVAQEHVAELGSIAGHWLPSFWATIDPAVIAAAKGPHWERLSLRARVAFWERANERLGRLSNRLGPDLKRIRIAVHKRVPWPMEAERRSLDILEAQHEVKLLGSGYEQACKMIESNERLMARVAEQNRDLRQAAMHEAKAMTRSASLWLRGRPAGPEPSSAVT